MKTTRSQIIFLGTSDGVLLLSECTDGYEVTERYLPGAYVTDLNTINGSVFASTKSGELYAFRQSRFELVSRFDKRLWFVEQTKSQRVFVGGTPAFLAYSDDLITWCEVPELRTYSSARDWKAHSGGEPHIHSLIESAKSNAIYIGFEQGGVMRSNDCGANWVDESHNVDADTHLLLALEDGCLLVSSGVGMFTKRVEDKSWSKLSISDLKYCQSVAALSDDIVMVAASRTPFGRNLSGRFVGTCRLNRFGILKSQDGRTFKEAVTLSGGVLSKAMKALPDQSGVVFGCLDGSVQTYKSDGSHKTLCTGISSIIECLYVSGA